ncbi:hypothetical protein [Brevundimonas lutea]|uniref:hypothetical protein n=1 Tax=Brevundimonas lutea TaxID=2293980 RepID=UPI000F01366E|nr:hypothetical protein [Brevundimonas lutea]
MTRSTSEPLPNDMHDVTNALAPDVGAASNGPGSKGPSAVARSTHDLSHMADHLRQDGKRAAATTRRHLSAAVRDHPNAANVGSSVLFSLIAALLATFALTRLAQS